MKKSVLLAIPIIFVVLTSGCAIPGTDINLDIFNIFGTKTVEFENDMVIIKDLQAVPSSTIRSGQSINVYAYVQNRQKPENDPHEVTVQLYNDCGLYSVSTICPANSNNGVDEKSCTFTMYPQSTQTVQWKLTAENVNVETECELGFLVKYDYTTYTTSSITFVNQRELENLILQGKQFNEKGTIIAGEGPVKPYVEIAGQPIQVDTDKQGEEAGSAVATFWVENKGSGELLGNTIKTVDIHEEPMLNKLNGTEECNPTQSSEKRKNPEPVKLIGKESPKYSCEISLKNTPEVQISKTYQISTKIEYTYKFIKKLKTTIKSEIEL
jgi:hypothetical protein